ncbi:MAG: enoyl-CoA hydratase [Pseudomonadota bacterium]
MSSDILIRKDAGPISYLTLNSPKSLNALSDAMLAAMRRQLLALMQDDRQRVIVLKGAGRAFCAGHDLKEMQAKRNGKDRGAAEFASLFDACSDVMQLISRLPQPVIAQVHGLATAAGCQLVSTCDLAIADEAAQFGVNGVNIGLFCSTPMVGLSRNMPRKRVFEMLVTGEFISAARAQELGLINRVASPGSLAAETDALAQKIASKLGSAVRIGKRAFYDQLELPVSRAYDMTRAVMVENMLNTDTAEGMQAFIEKRDPSWSQ